MEDFISRYENIRTGDDLFSWWEQECRLRTEIRTAPEALRRLENQEECEFMYRSWFFTARRYDFFDLLLRSLDNWEILKWLDKRDDDTINVFLDYLAWRLCIENIKPERLQFLISLFRHDYPAALNKVLRALNLEQCRYLSARTGNSELRNLIKEQEKSFLADIPFHRSGLWQDKRPSIPYPTIYGDKFSLLHDAAEKTAHILYGHFWDPVGQERFNAWLEACDLVFKSGLVQDAFFMLKEMYDYYQKKNRIASVFADGQIYKSFTRLTRTVIPILALQQAYLQPYDTAVYMFDKYFNRLNRDPGSLAYLRLYESIREGLRGHNKEILWEVLYKCNFIKQYRPWDTALLKENDLTEPLSNARVDEWLTLADERIGSRPHETLTILEMLRLLHQKNLLTGRQLQANRILDMYFDLWKWVPGSFFVNQRLIEHLTPLLDSERRRRAQKLSNAIKQMNRDRIMQDLTARPQLFGQKDAWAQRQILFGYILGVLD